MIDELYPYSYANEPNKSPWKERLWALLPLREAATFPPQADHVLVVFFFIRGRPECCVKAPRHKLSGVTFRSNIWVFRTCQVDRVREVSKVLCQQKWVDTSCTSGWFQPWGLWFFMLTCFSKFQCQTAENFSELSNGLNFFVHKSPSSLILQVSSFHWGLRAFLLTPAPSHCVLYSYSSDSPAYAILSWHLLLTGLKCTPLGFRQIWCCFSFILACKSDSFLLSNDLHPVFYVHINIDPMHVIIVLVQSSNHYKIKSQFHFLLHKVICFWGLFFILTNLTFDAVLNFLSFPNKLRTFMLLWLCLFCFLYL